LGRRIYGDGAITPAISVLSALEGVEQITPSLTPWVIYGAVAILVALFALQPLRTARIGRAFGPVMLIWFGVMAAMGIYGVLQYPSVLVAINPDYGLKYLASGGLTGFLVLGGVFLCVTGAEGMYWSIPYSDRRLPAVTLSEVNATSKRLHAVGERNVNQRQIFASIDEQRALVQQAVSTTKRARQEQERTARSLRGAPGGCSPRPSEATSLPLEEEAGPILPYPVEEWTT
jgi:hypothetical protein